MEKAERNALVPRLLVVDDKMENRLLITEYLDDLKVEIDEAESGYECLEKLRSGDFTLVILDIQMPGMDGFEVLTEMRKDPRLKEIPVVFISAIYDSDQYVLKGIECGAIDFLAKPINILILKSKVSNFLKLYDRQNKLDSLVKKLESTNVRLNESEKRIKKITHSANDSIIVLDANYKITFWNRASKEMFGFVKYEIIYENFFEKVISPGSREMAMEYYKVAEIYTDRKMNSTVRLTALNRNGNEFPIEMSASSFLNTKKAINYSVVIRDITQRVQMEKDALQAKELRESNRVMKEFMDSVSHELRTPMNAILGISDMLLKYNSANLMPKQLEGLQIINQSGTRLLEMINDVLDLSRIESNKLTVVPEQFNLNKFLAALRSLILSLIDGKPIKFHIHKSTNVPEILLADQKKLNQVLLNLLGNAVKFTPLGKIFLFIHILGDKLYFEVTDSGIGIAEENLNIIFEKFRQIDNSASKEYKGTGLGLNICKKLVELMEGEIWVESHLGEGSTFKFFIPYVVMKSDEKSEVEEQQPALNHHGVPSNLDLQKKLVLLIEDSKENNYWYTQILSESGFEVLSYFNSLEGLEAIKMYLPDAIVLKMEMPLIHGHFLMNEIFESKILNNTPLTIISSVQDLMLPLEHHSASVLFEPISDQQFISQLQKSLEQNNNSPAIKVLVLHEEKCRLKDYLKAADECFTSQSFESLVIMLTRRKIETLYLDGAHRQGPHLKIIDWLTKEPAHRPERIVLVSSHETSEELLKERTFFTSCMVIDFRQIEELESVEAAIEKLNPKSGLISKTN
jgi:PAS domain S-box-containing protein